MVLLAGFSFYFLRNEFLQILKSDFASYFGSMWNYVDIIPPVLNYVIIIMNFMPEDDIS